LRYSMVEMDDSRAEEQGRHEGTHRENIEGARCVILLSYSRRYMYSIITALARLLQHCMIKSAREKDARQSEQGWKSHISYIWLFSYHPMPTQQNVPMRQRSTSSCWKRKGEKQGLEDTVLRYKRCTRGTRESSWPGVCRAHQVHHLLGASSVSVNSLFFALFTTSSRILLSAFLIQGAFLVLFFSIKGSISQRMKSIDSS
jgi:hypothetical protein